MIDLEALLPLLNAGSILISGILLLAGFYFIRRGRQIRRHRRAMLAATVFAGLFLTVYVTRWILFDNKSFAGTGWLRLTYLGILGSHMLLAIAVAPLALVTLYLGLSRDFRRHRRLARITFPTWLYVAATGWIIYWMLYHLL